MREMSGGSLLVVFFCISLIMASQMWNDKAMNQRLAMAECLHREHRVLLYTLVVPVRALNEKKEMHAHNLEEMARMLRAGTSFCHAYAHVLDGMLRSLQKRARRLNTDDKKAAFDQRGLYATVTHLQQLSANRDVVCQEAERRIPLNDTQRIDGVRSSVHRCMQTRRKQSIAALADFHFGDE